MPRMLRIKIKGYFINRMLRNTWSDEEQERHILEGFHFLQQNLELCFGFVEHNPTLPVYILLFIQQ